MVYYCIVCFYNSNMEGPFTVDYIFKDMKKAFTQLKALSGEVHLFISESPQIAPGDTEDFHVYLDIKSKKLYICITECEFTTEVLHDKIPLPPLN